MRGERPNQKSKSITKSFEKYEYEDFGVKSPLRFHIVHRVFEPALMMISKGKRQATKASQAQRNLRSRRKTLTHPTNNNCDLTLFITPDRTDRLIEISKHDVDEHGHLAREPEIRVIRLHPNPSCSIVLKEVG
ncbi:hypothetical protein EVAR_90843_1 [Eumeta japonica]|uniref:Uncharacterized protein n=1 Tax=Eumeta variegata TaxID=151549 RepID=A0A4C1ZUQ9_EUMVA|nr:hypothetical protein EVAR_90843_1 [Eumeta japonica]